jgi:hypothetical protein
VAAAAVAVAVVAVVEEDLVAAVERVQEEVEDFMAAHRAAGSQVAGALPHDQVAAVELVAAAVVGLTSAVAPAAGQDLEEALAIGADSVVVSATGLDLAGV